MLVQFAAHPLPLRLLWIADSIGPQCLYGTQHHPAVYWEARGAVSAWTWQRQVKLVRLAAFSPDPTPEGAHCQLSLGYPFAGPTHRSAAMLRADLRGVERET